MPNLNKIVLAGYLVRDPERRVTAGNYSGPNDAEEVPWMRS